MRDLNGSNCFLEDHFFIDHQDSEESGAGGEGITYEELKETEGFKSFIEVFGTAKNSDVSLTKSVHQGFVH